MAQPSPELVKESNKALVWTGIIIVIFIAGLLTNGFGLFNQSQEDIPPIALAIDQSPVIGQEDAPVTIYEFSDFSCPYCAAVVGEQPAVIQRLGVNWEPPIPGLIRDYVETGKAKLVFKYFSPHGSGRPAHAVGLALYDQDPDLFWEFKTLAFRNQADVSSLDKMKEIAENLGADMTKLNADMSTKNYYARLTEENKMGLSNGVTGTPSFIINGRLIGGAVSYPQLKSVIDQELAKAS